MTTTILAHNAKVGTVEGMGTVTEAYTERRLELGSLAYSETTTMSFIDGTSTVYVYDLIETRHGKWAVSSVCDDGLTGEHTEEYPSITDEDARRWIATRRGMYGIETA